MIDLRDRWLLRLLWEVGSECFRILPKEHFEIVKVSIFVKLDGLVFLSLLIEIQSGEPWDVEAFGFVLGGIKFTDS
jgi:hypothetical protein